MWARVNKRADKLISIKRQSEQNKVKHDKRVKNRQVLHENRKKLGRV
jgi:hypothetical protein